MSLTPQQLQQATALGISASQYESQINESAARSSYKAPIDTSATATPVSSVTTSSAKDTLAKDLTKLNGVSPTTAPGYIAPPPTEPAPVQDSGGLAATDIYSAGGNLGDFTVQPDGKYLPKDNTLSSDVSSANSAVKTLVDQFNSYSVDTDPEFQAKASSIKAQYDELIRQMNVQNQSRANALATIGYRTGAQQYSGSIQEGIQGAELTQANQRIADLNRQEADAISIARSAYQSGKFTEFSKKIDALQTVRDNKQKELEDYNKKLTDVVKAVTDKNTQDAKDFYTQVTKPIQDIGLEIAKNNAPAEIRSAVAGAKTLNEAIAAAGDYLQTGTGTLGDYLQYKRDTLSKGLVPADYQPYKDQQDAKALKQKVAEAYATQSAKNQADANSTASDKVQQKLEQQYRQVLSKEFSSRTGALGVENAKVNQANHLDSLITQYYDAKTGNYNIPTSQYNELILGLANLVSPGGVASDSLRSEINQKTAAGKFNEALSFITGQPQTGNTQEMIKNIIDSVDRQAQTAEQNREAALQNMRDQAPTDLEQSRIDALNKSTQMVSYTGQERISKSNVDKYVLQHPDEADNIAKLYEVPGATDQDIESYLQAQGKI